MKNFSIFTAGLIVLALAFSCQSETKQPEAQPPVDTPAAADTTAVAVPDFYQTAGDSLVIPTFEVAVWASPKAAADLKKRKETVIVSAFFWADPIDPKKKEMGEDGEVFVLKKDVELSGANLTARFEGLKFDKNLLKQMDGTDIHLLINVFSGRKSTDDNLLACGLVDAMASNFRNHRYVVACPLITGDTDGNALPTVPFALPDDGSQPNGPLPIVVDCSEKGEISFAGTPVATVDELKPLLKEALLALRKQGSKTTPEIQTAGCLMGMQGAIRDMYEELKSEK
jgi:hypothetical protein